MLVIAFQALLEGAAFRQHLLPFHAPKQTSRLGRLPTCQVPGCQSAGRGSILALRMDLTTKQGTGSRKSPYPGAQNLCMAKLGFAARLSSKRSPGIRPRALGDSSFAAADWA